MLIWAVSKLVPIPTLPPTLTDPPIPAPPETVKAPVEVEVESAAIPIFTLLDVIAILFRLLIAR